MMTTVHATVPDPGSVGEGSAPPRVVRRKAALWDRTKFLILLAVLFAFFLWEELSDNPLMSVERRPRDHSQLEIVDLRAGRDRARPPAPLSSISEHWAGLPPVLDREGLRPLRAADRRSVNPWTRYRVGRVLKWLLFLGSSSIILGALFDAPPLTALFELPARLVDALPFAFQMMFGFFYVILQFVGLFWFLSRGGIDVYFPDDIKTRFTDVWGQDHVLERVKENIVFLEEPELIEEKGGYVPVGILLWGPPGTGKTLMAEAVAGETGKPFVFVDPGRLHQHVHGRRHPEGEVAVPEAAQARPALRRRDRLLRRGRLPRQPRGQLSGGVPGRHGGSPFDHDHLRLAGYRLRPRPRSCGHRCRATPSSAARAGRRRDHHGRDGRRRRDGHAPGPAHRAVRPEEARGFLNRVVRRTLGMQPKPPPKYRILVMMATNMPDGPRRGAAPARPHRPHLQGRLPVARTAASGPTRATSPRCATSSPPEQIEKLAVITPYATGARSRTSSTRRSIIAIRDGRDTITWADVIKAKHLKELGPAEDVEYIERERHAVAIHEACHAVAAYRLRAPRRDRHRHHREAAATTSALCRQHPARGPVQPTGGASTRPTSWSSLASLAGERMFFDGDNSSGVSAATSSRPRRWPRCMEGFWGMGETLSSSASPVTSSAAVAAAAAAVEDGDGPSRSHKTASASGSRPNLRRALRADRGAARGEPARGPRRRPRPRDATRRSRARTSPPSSTATPGPLVDGRLYRDRGFLEQAEAYHALAAGRPRRARHRSRRSPAPPAARRCTPTPAPASPYEASRNGAAGKGNGPIRTATRGTAARPGRASPSRRRRSRRHRRRRGLRRAPVRRGQPEEGPAEAAG